MTYSIIMKILLFGASGAGATTQGNDLSKVLGIPYFDTDNYFWEKSDIPYTIRKDPGERNNLLKSDLNKQNSWILGGSIVSWGKEWLSAFDLAIFLYVPSEIRISRIKKREFEKYGDIIFTDPQRIRLYNEFVKWSMGYDDNTAKGRTLAAHEDWMKSLTCPLIVIKGDFSLIERREIILKQLKAL